MITSTCNPSLMIYSRPTFGIIMAKASVSIEYCVRAMCVHNYFRNKMSHRRKRVGLGIMHVYVFLEHNAKSYRKNAFGCNITQRPYTTSAIQLVGHPISNTAKYPKFCNRNISLHLFYLNVNTHLCQ